MKIMLWLCKMILIAMLVTGVSAATTWLMVNAYVQQFIDGLPTGETLRPVSVVDLLVPREGEQAEDRKQTVEPAGSEKPADSPEQADAPQGAMPVMGDIEFSGEREEMLFSMEELNEKKESLTERDRTEIFTLLASRLPAEEVQNLSSLMEDGFTAEEIGQASDILQAYLTEEQYIRLIEIIEKY